MEKTHSKNIHMGNQGEHIVATRLSANCIVRDVGQGKDTGIDLYCEILNDQTRELSLHFFCQVKTVNGQLTLNSIEDKYFEYWASQPVPVFLVAVEYTEEKNIQGSHELWVYDIPYILIKRDAKAVGIELSRNLEAKFKLCSESNDRDRMSLDDFLYGHVSFSYGLWQLRRFGLVLPNPEIREKKGEVFVGGLTYLYREKIAKVAQYAKLSLEKVNIIVNWL